MVDSKPKGLTPELLVELERAYYHRWQHVASFLLGFLTGVFSTTAFGIIWYVLETHGR